MPQADRETLLRDLRKTRRAVALLLGLSVGLLGALAAALWFILPAMSQGDAIDLQQALADQRTRDRVVAELVNRGQGLFDTHNDPDVGRVLQPNLRDREAFGYRISSNALGLREKDYALPKPAGLTRVVLLGDSLIFGLGVKAEDRMGVLLERHLRERTAVQDARIEVLHIAIGSWNVVAESAYLRRQMSLIQPDLVIHLTTNNDLDDMEGVRGFGAMSAFSPQRRAFADSRVVGHYPSWGLGVGTSNNLLTGVEHEGRSRYERSRQAILRLKEAAERIGARYVMWSHWGPVHPFVRVHLTDGLEPEEVLYISEAFALDKTFWVNEEDPHWNPTGMERMAKLLYGAIHARELLPALNLEEWEQARQVLREEHETEWKAAQKDPPYDSWLAAYPVSTDFEFARLSAAISAQVSGGLDPEGRVSPYAAFHLESAPGDTVLIRGRGLGRSEIDGVEVRIYADEFELGTFRIGADDVFERQWALPTELDDRVHISIRLISSDYAYVGKDLQHCVAFQLERIATLPAAK